MKMEWEILIKNKLKCFKIRIIEMRTVING